MNTTTPKRDHQQEITDAIVRMIEDGQTGDGAPLWTRLQIPQPVNLVSHRPYRGINTLVLWAAAADRGYTSSTWATFQQWKDKGLSVRKGEKATHVVYWHFPDRQARDDEDDDAQEAQDTPGAPKKRYGVFMRFYCVFAAEQIEGYTPTLTADRPPEQRIEDAEEFFRGIGAEVNHGGNRAFYSPSGDRIQMPEFWQFRGPEDYYSVLAHEHIHWTGAVHRLDRTKGHSFGDEDYAFEELVAELGAAFTMSHLALALEPRPDHAHYIASWLRALKNDKRFIFSAASKAQKAADYLADAAETGRQAQPVLAGELTAA